ncbi:zinc finger (C3HC4 RING finger) protein, putative [Eimeria brunetti]|uniref:Zinc finger (C3HC4 RING finger) protein, putative n=1 Tax=Eimeria brunetti TaxID=51314 RepID=U6LBM9_9EIME|nr:zinc finger (C3HC4 RING finger) protein, putative [Eimeria brunetti]
MQRSPRPTPRAAWPTAADSSAAAASLPSIDASVPVATDAPRRQKRVRVGGSVQRTPAAPAVAESEDDSEGEQCIAFEGDEGLDVSFPLKAVEKMFRCPLCNGYFRDAVTIKECLHTFCRWCLYDYVEGSETEEVCCPYCERNMQLMTPHRDGAGKDSRHYMPRVTAACVAGAGSVVSVSSNTSGTSAAAAAANAAVLFDRTMQNLVDKLFPHFAQQERLEEEELQRYMQQHQHKQLPPEYLAGGLSSPGALRREALSHRRARLEARAATEEALGPRPIEPPVPPEPQQQQQQQIDVSRSEGATEQRTGVRSSSTTSRSQQQQQQQQLQQSLDEFVDQLLGSPTCFDEQQTTAIALLPDTYQGQLMEARVQYQAPQLSQGSPEGPQIGVGGPQGRQDLLGLPLKLPHIDRPYLRVPSRMSVQLVLRYLASQLQPLLCLGGPSGGHRDSGSSHMTGGAGSERVGEGLLSSDCPVDLETALELTLEGRVLGRSHSIDFVRKARRLNCAGRCLLLQYRYSAQTEARVIAYHLSTVDRSSGTLHQASSPVAAEGTQATGHLLGSL